MGRLYKVQTFSFCKDCQVSVAQDKLLEDRIHNLLPRYKSKKLSKETNVNEMVCMNSLLSRPLKKRQRFCSSGRGLKISLGLF